MSSPRASMPWSAIFVLLLTRSVDRGRCLVSRFRVPQSRGPDCAYELLHTSGRVRLMGHRVESRQQFTGPPRMGNISLVAEPGMNRSQQRLCRGTPALNRPKPCESGRCAQLEQPRRLITRYLDRPEKLQFSLGIVGPGERKDSH